MALNELINQIVDVQIRNVTSNTYSRDLNTIAVLSKHDVFTAPEVYRVYQSSSAMAEDGFDLDSYAYNAVRVIFSQEITPINVVVGRVPTYSESSDDYVTALNQLLMIPQGWTWLISDLRDKETQITIAGIVEENDKMYLAATHDCAALNPMVTTDLASELKELGYSNTAVWFDDELGDQAFCQIAPKYNNYFIINLIEGETGNIHDLLNRIVNEATVSISGQELVKSDTQGSKGYYSIENIDDSYVRIVVAGYVDVEIRDYDVVICTPVQVVITPEYQ